MIKDRLKEIIKKIGNNPEKIVLWFFLFILVAMSSYLIVRWHAKEVPGVAVPVVAEKPLEAPVLIDFSGLIKGEGYFRERFLGNIRDPFSHQPLVPRPGIDPRPDPIPIIEPPRPRLTGMVTIGERRVAFIRIGRETHQVTGGENINGWKVLNIGENSVTLYNEKKRQELTLFIIH